MMSRATTTIDVFRDSDDTDHDEWGDEVETGPAVLSKLPASILLRSSRPMESDGDTPQPKGTNYVGRVGYGTDVREGDRVRDVNGSWYAVSGVTDPPSLPGVRPDRRLDLWTMGG
jgi:hypothetical protein